MVTDGRFVDMHQLLPCFLAQLGVQVGQRFVQEQQADSGDKGPAQGDTLLLAA
jgi:hypothetical protein